MQNLINDTHHRKNYDFVDSIRCIAMISIVMEHCFFFDQHMYHPTSKISTDIFAVIVQVIKFGTICFFLLAGFLIGEKFNDYSPIQYMKRRINTTIAPWVVWSLIFLATMLINDFVVVVKFYHGKFPADFSQHLIDHIKLIYLYSSFWYIPNFLVCIGILLLFRKYLYNYWLGAVLLLFTTLYIVNIYGVWIEPRHSTAILGFVFFLWLGAQLNKNLGRFENWVNKTPIWVWSLITIITLFLSLKEADILTGLHSIDPYNSLRLSNILYSLACFFLLFRIRNFPFTLYLRPRETTYGIHLIHFILVYSLLPMLFPSLKFSVNHLSTGMILLYQLARFIIVYSISLVLVRAIMRTRFKWAIGR